MATLPNDGNDLTLRRTTSSKSGSQIHRNVIIVKFDISSLAGETIDTALLNMYLSLNQFTGAQAVRAQGRRLIDSGSGVAQTWTEATAAATIVPVGDYTHNNGPLLDQLLFDISSPISTWYQWDIAAGLQLDIDATNTYFTACISRFNMGGTGTATTQNTALNQIRAEGTQTQHINFSSDEAGSNEPFIDYALVSAGAKNYYLGGNVLNRSHRGIGW